VDVIVGAIESEKFDITDQIIKEKGGDSIQKELHRWLEFNGGVPAGDAILSESGKFKCKYILHVVGTFAAEGEDAPRRATRHLYGCIKNLLDNADYLCATSISIPSSLAKSALGDFAGDAT
jgi:O-acetyl-ADP-ribose deacetylase (regulator of RNase III)